MLRRKDHPVEYELLTTDERLTRCAIRDFDSKLDALLDVIERKREEEARVTGAPSWKIGVVYHFSIAWPIDSVMSPSGTLAPISIPKTPIEFADAAKMIRQQQEELEWIKRKLDYASLITVNESDFNALRAQRKQISTTPRAYRSIYVDSPSRDDDDRLAGA